MRSQRGRGVTGVCSIVSSVLRTSHAVGVSVLGMPRTVAVGAVVGQLFSPAGRWDARHRAGTVHDQLAPRQ